MKFQARFYHISMFETLLLVIRASRQQCWELHLEALNATVLYFFAFGMLNYARLTPVYLSQIIKWNENDRETWEVLQRSNFNVSKWSVPFPAIDADHGLEQQNRALRVLGGIKWIANSQTALDEFFMTAGEMSLLLDQFTDHYHLRNSRNTKEHYQLSGSKNKRISDNTQKLSQILDAHNLSFENAKNLYNVLTNKVMPNDQALRFLNAGGTGDNKYKFFIEQRLIGDKSIWDTITKEKIPTFVCNNKQITVTVNKELVNLKKEKKLKSKVSCSTFQTRNRFILLFGQVWAVRFAEIVVYCWWFSSQDSW